MIKQHIVILTGAGISAESGISTFRDADGLWEGHDIMEVASPQGFAKNPELVLDFYNKRRAQLHTVKPNAGHEALVSLEEKYEVTVITQNVDNLHQQAGSTNVIHLHGELFKARSITDSSAIVEWTEDIHLGTLADDGSQLRPHIVWFGEDVPMIERAVEISSTADVFIIIGTSLKVYPAAGLVRHTPVSAELYLIDPNKPDGVGDWIEFLQGTATEKVPELVEKLMG